MTRHSFHLRLLALAKHKMQEHQRRADEISHGIAQVLGKDTRETISKIIEGQVDKITEKIAGMVNDRELREVPDEVVQKRWREEQELEKHRARTEDFKKRSVEDIQKDIRTLDQAMSVGVGKPVRNPFGGYDGNPGVAEAGNPMDSLASVPSIAGTQGAPTPAQVAAIASRQQR